MNMLPKYFKPALCVFKSCPTKTSTKSVDYRRELAWSGNHSLIPVATKRPRDSNKGLPLEFNAVFIV